MRVALNVAAGFNYEGSHPETKGLTADGRVVRVPLHRHSVSLDYVRAEVELEYAFARGWDLIFRAPIDSKVQSSRVEFIEPATAEEQAAMLRNMNIHHRNEAYRGISDITLLAAHRRYGLLRTGDFFKISLGATLPTGRTEANPYLLGRQGIEHLHIQFGTGTMNPYLETYYRLPLTGALSFSPYFFGRFPFYENDKGYRGPAELTTGANLAYRLRRRVSVHANFTYFRQNFAQWSGELDLNTGLNATSGMFGVTFEAWENTTFGVDYRQPLSQTRLSAGGDSFRQGPTMLVRIARSFPR